MSASLHLLSLTPQSLALHHSSASPGASATCLFNPVSLKPQPNVFLSVSSVNMHSHVGSRFTRRVAISSEVDEEEEEEEEEEYSRSQTNFSPDLKLFVGNLPFDVDSSALAGLFEQAGNVEMVEVIYDKVTGRSRGFGFVTMSKIEEVETAAQQFNGYDMRGRTLRVNYGPPPEKRETSAYGSSRPPRGGGGSDNSNRVYVGNLAWGVDNLALENLFSEQGNVKEARVVYDRETGRSRGFGFVTYNSPDEVNKAVDQLDGADLDGRPIRVSPAESRPARQF